MFAYLEKMLTAICSSNFVFQHTTLHELSKVYFPSSLLADSFYRLVSYKRKQAVQSGVKGEQKKSTSRTLQNFNIFLLKLECYWVEG